MHVPPIARRPFQVQVCTSPEVMATAAAREFLRRGRDAIGARGRFSVALSGGSTPRNLFRALVEEAPGEAFWRAVHVFWGDERTVGPGDPESNYRMAREELWSKVGIPEGNIYRMRGEDPDPARAAREYEEALRRFFDPAPECLPRLDLVLLGMGDDGHTASLFPGTAAVEEQSRWVVANWVERLETTRLTLTLPVLNAAACALFLVTGEDKAEMVARVLEGPPGSYPAQAVRPLDGELLWLLDRAAAQRLTTIDRLDRATPPHALAD